MNNEFLIGTVVVLCFLIGVGLLWAVWNETRKKKIAPGIPGVTLPILTVEENSEAGLSQRLLGSPDTLKLLFDSKVLWPLFLSNLKHNTRVKSVKEIRGQEKPEGAGPSWDPDYKILLLSDGTMDMVLRAEMARVPTATYIMPSGGDLDSYKGGDDRFECCLSMSLLVRSDQCGEECRTDLISAVNAATAGALVMEKAIKSAGRKSFTYEIVQDPETGAYEVAEMTSKFDHIPESELDVYYAPPTVTNSAGSFRPPMSVVFKDVLLAAINAGRNIIITGKYRSGKTTLVKNLIDVVTKTGTVVVRLDHDTLKARQPIIRATLSGWLTKQKAMYAEEDFSVLFIVDEATAHVDADTVPNLLELMDGFRTEAERSSVFLSCSADPSTLPADLTAPGRTSNIVQLRHFTSVEADRLIKHLSKEGMKIDPTVVAGILGKETISDKGSISLGELMENITREGRVPLVSPGLEQFRVTNNITKNAPKAPPAAVDGD